jgi:hypothetical protein
MFEVFGIQNFLTALEEEWLQLYDCIKHNKL